jgi:YVTN family beta-propeller protein
VLDPAGSSIALGSMPVTMTFSPDSSRIVTVLSGYRDQGVQVVDLASHRVVQTLVQGSAFVGATFAPDGRTLYVSGGDRDVVYRYAWREDSASLVDSIPLGPAPGAQRGHRHPAGLGTSGDGRRLYVAENLADSLAVVDLPTARVIERLATGRYPCDVVVHPDGRVYVSAWGDSWVASFTPRPSGLSLGPRIAVCRHPAALLLDPRGSRLYVACATCDRIAVVDTRRSSMMAVLDDAVPGAPDEGSTPNGLALSPDGRTLYVAEADNNALAVFQLSAGTSGIANGPGRDSLVGRVPVEWYPEAVLTRRDSLWVLNGKGRGTAPNPRLSQPGRAGPREPFRYTLGQTSGSLSLLAVPQDRSLRGLSRRVAIANHWDRLPAEVALPPFQHVVYVIRENRSFDQVFGDLAGADADSSLAYFPRAVTPNAHALAERFGIFDRFFTSGEVSGDGHDWCMAAYVPDYVEKTLPSDYSGRRRMASDTASVPADDVDDPSRGYLWDLAHRSQVSLRNYGEFTQRARNGSWVGIKPWLARSTDPEYPGFDLSVADTSRANRWIAEFRRQVAGDSMPALTILWLPNDHTAGARAGMRTPRAFAADNDLALGRVVEAITRSRCWKSTVVFVLEDDAQDGPDHVDSHRSVLLVVSAYNHAGLVHRFTNTTDVVATIDHVLRLGPLSKFDRYASPLTFASTPDTSPYSAIIPGVPMSERNPDRTPSAILSRRLDLSHEDRADAHLLNRILWRTIKGMRRPYPARLLAE